LKARLYGQRAAAGFPASARLILPFLPLRVKVPSPNPRWYGLLFLRCSSWPRPRADPRYDPVRPLAPGGLLAAQ
jgi:hypothetical protein